VPPEVISNGSSQHLGSLNSFDSLRVHTQAQDNIVGTLSPQREPFVWGFLTNNLARSPFAKGSK
jgi:hypothetical protein